jgi:hypothetical protein
MEQFGSGELFVKLLTPISFLIFTLVQVRQKALYQLLTNPNISKNVFMKHQYCFAQVNFFHTDLMDRTHKWQTAVYPHALARASMLWRRMSVRFAVVGKAARCDSIMQM